ncbi:MAG: type I restriction endonuclease [Chloroflexi bacterium]|nr:type I restriction endonuclease [Chloroflexota bacterium]
MSQQLLNTVRRVQTQIVNHPKAFEIEQQTLNSLINPVLYALGWDTRDHNHVRYEFKTARHNKVDIALMHNSYPEVFLEAKSLKHKLDESYEDDLRNYCNEKNVKTGILTNGAEWRAYHFYQPKQSGSDYKSILLFQVQLSEDEEAATSATSQLSMFARDSINELNTKKRSILLNRYWQEEGRVKLLEYLLRNYSRKFRDFFQEWGGLTAQDHEVRTLLNEKLSPIQQRSTFVPQSEPQPLEAKNETEALIKVAEWLIVSGKLTQEKCPVMRGGRSQQILIHNEKQHSNWSSYSQMKELPNGFFIDTHGDSKEMIRLAKMLLENHAPSYKPEDLIRFSS